MLQAKNRASRAYGAMSLDENRLIRENQSLVTKIAWQVKSFAPEQMEIEDLIQVGLIAMIEAAKAPPAGLHRHTYASMISLAARA